MFSISNNKSVSVHFTFSEVSQSLKGMRQKISQIALSFLGREEAVPLDSTVLRDRIRA